MAIHNLKKRTINKLSKSKQQNIKSFTRTLHFVSLVYDRKCNTYYIFQLNIFSIQFRQEKRHLIQYLVGVKKHKALVHNL